MSGNAFASGVISTEKRRDMKTPIHGSTRPEVLSRARKGGFTITELLVASTIALSVMAAVATLFATFGSAASQSQSIVDMTNRLRTAASKLREDLAGVTASLRPPLSPESNSGYFEIIEGPRVDSMAVSGTLVADWDDVLLFTTQSPSRPFTGRFVVSGSDTQLESSAAEVAWFCRQSSVESAPGLTLFTLYRRQLLVAGYVGAAPFHQPGNAATNQISASIPAVFNSYDVSLRNEDSVLVPNTMSDLSQRENRFLHGAWNTGFSTLAAGAIFDAASGREGEDVVLTNVLSFDVRVFDPEAMARTTSGVILYPGDPGYASGAGTTTKGVFVDLGRANVGTILTGPAASKAGGLEATYDTWSMAYETNGLENNTPANAAVDDAVNGADNTSPADGLPDDPGESETSPPYPVPLKAIEVRIRCYDPTSRQVRQVTVRQAFAN